MFVLAWEILYMGTFIFGISFCLHYLAYHRDIADEFDVVKTKSLKKDKTGKKRDYKTGNTLLDKWLDFGGGYYGIVALLHLVFIELAQIKEFISGWQGLSAFIDDLGIGTIVNFFVEQFMNFVAAICWPVDYLSRFSIFEIAVFIAITYVVHEMARKLARKEINKSLVD